MKRKLTALGLTLAAATVFAVSSPRNAILIDNFNNGSVAAAPLLQPRPAPRVCPGPAVTVTTFTTGLDNPHGMKFGPDGLLYVAEAGRGGPTPPPAGCTGPFQYYSGFTSRISRIDALGKRTTVSDGLPSAVDNFNGYWGVFDVAFIGEQLYGLFDGGGCVRGHPDFPTSVIRINRQTGQPTIVADLIAYTVTHPVANPDLDDYEPEGSWWNLIAVGRELYTVNPNLGDFVRVSLNGDVERIVDLSAEYGHIVPTALTCRRNSFRYQGNFYIANLGTFPIQAGSSNLFKITPAGQNRVVRTGLSAVTGIAFDKRDRLYVLQASTTDGSFLADAGEGSIVRIEPSGAITQILSGLDYPASITFGPDGDLYVTNNGFSPVSNGAGTILRIRIAK